MTRIASACVVFTVILSACGGARPCETDVDCQLGEACESKVCVQLPPRDDAGSKSDAGTDAGTSADAGMTSDAGMGMCMPGIECRASTGSCDVAEVCGFDGQCPPDLASTVGTVCRGASGACDLAETCDGINTACPGDAFASSSLRCRVASGVCDVDDFCTGTSATCFEAVRPSSEVCRASSGACDAEERCDGTNAACPADAFQSPSVVCRASAGSCDAEERCTGNSNACPTDAVAANTVICRAAAGVCDAEERCTGSSNMCPADAVAAVTVVCRAAAGLCDSAELCTGTSSACPVDSLLPSNVVCRSAVSGCDMTDWCTGTSSACPSDAFQPSNVVCRPAAGSCDVEDRCTGSSTVCPADAVQPATTQCAALECNAGSFTYPRTCTGSSASCPAPGTQMSCGGFVCTGPNTCGTTCSSNSQCIATHFCQFGTCALRAADGESCIGGNGTGCQSGICTQTYLDSDGDGYGTAGRPVYTCGAAAPAGRSLVAGDCCDTEARAFPGSTVSSSTARNVCGGFDFDCDGSETKSDTSANPCQPSACNVACSGGTGWLAGVAACGATESYVSACGQLPCSFMSPQLRCAPILENRTQSCR